MVAKRWFRAELGSLTKSKYPDTVELSTKTPSLGEKIMTSVVHINFEHETCVPSTFGCLRHVLRSQSCIDATHSLTGVNLNDSGEVVGGGVLAWAYSEAHATELMKALEPCKFYGSLKVGTEGTQEI
jgi:hypothetical protein